MVCAGPRRTVGLGAVHPHARLPNPADRRSSLLELTPEGRRLFAEAGAAFDEELQRLLGAAVPERTLRQFAATLARLRSAGERVEIEESA